MCNAWGESCQIGLGKTAVSETKKAVEGEWPDGQIIFGPHANVIDETIALQKSNIDGANRLAGGSLYPL